MTRYLTLAACATFAVARAGCGASEPEQSEVSEQDRQEMIRKDAEQVLKERQESARPRGVR